MVADPIDVTAGGPERIVNVNVPDMVPALTVVRQVFSVTVLPVVTGPCPASTSTPSTPTDPDTGRFKLPRPRVPCVELPDWVSVRVNPEPEKDPQKLPVADPVSVQEDLA